MTPTLLTEELVLADLATLNHGGQQAIALFLKMSRRLHEQGAKDALQDWITIAAPALPEKERNEVLVMLMCSFLFSNRQAQARVGAGASAPVLH
ncbi:MAG TPA: hypothetical protein VFP43_14145 [Mesorhizobium sp.]|nr:hypothetical protein [Mesorhizobium sp.]